MAIDTYKQRFMTGRFSSNIKHTCTHLLQWVTRTDVHCCPDQYLPTVMKPNYHIHVHWLLLLNHLPSKLK